ncbi:NADP-dependent oxidoreductase [Novosphingobium colocasiae]|uniref:NADP-dependent oxidoreductase n=2 Tax=Novosphingobium colocasiae TaxID=1256513 RepID=A0A918PN38_9SPHN|nr:NADP-dependent oxidoreductase [Novosphingobium colocasiae]
MLSEVAIKPLDDGQILVKNAFLSVDPAMRGWIADAPNYSEQVALGSVMRAVATGYVVESRHPAFQPGDAVLGWFGWQNYAVVGTAAVLRKISETELSLSLGLLGYSGATAYLALTTIGQPLAGETVVVSTAAGSVGSAAGQIAHILGCRTIGLTGGPAKVEACRTDFGYDHALDYQASDWTADLADLCVDGVNVYFDNTCGTISDVVNRHLALRARVIVCGTAAIDRWDPWPEGPRRERQLLVRRARMEDFVIFDHEEKVEAAIDQLRIWHRAGTLRSREDIVDGIEACPDAIAAVYRGENIGKRLIRLK